MWGTFPAILCQIFVAFFPSCLAEVFLLTWGQQHPAHGSTNIACKAKKREHTSFEEGFCFIWLTAGRRGNMNSDTSQCVFKMPACPANTLQKKSFLIRLSPCHGWISKVKGMNGWQQQFTSLTSSKWVVTARSYWMHSSVLLSYLCVEHVCTSALIQPMVVDKPKKQDWPWEQLS